MASLKYMPIGTDGFGCTLHTDGGLSIQLRGSLALPDPKVSTGSPELLANESVLSNSWAFAANERRKRSNSPGEVRTAYEKAAEAHRRLALGIAELVDLVRTEGRFAWCSACFTISTHRKVATRNLGAPVFLCDGCGAPTAPCAGPQCQSMASRGLGTVRAPGFCAEHRHEIPGFEKAKATIGSLDNYADFLRFEKRNLARASMYTIGTLFTAGVVGSGAWVAAPALGGAIGSLGGLTGAAATSHGLALLGGGAIGSSAIATGMAGGAVVVTAAGTGLGGLVGASVAAAYVGADKSFSIEKLKDGTGTPVVVASGFLSDSQPGWANWQSIVTTRYPDSPVYRVHWGAKELAAVGAALGLAAGGAVAKEALRRGALKATTMGAKKLGPLGPALLAADALKNPWSHAVRTAGKTGAVVADLIARTDAETYILVGHSLGGRVMVSVAEALATKRDGPRIEAVHLLGAAVSQSTDWNLLDEAVTDMVWNYHSSKDQVLNVAYRAAMLGKIAVGLKGFGSKLPRITDIDVTDKVNGHTEYCSRVALR